jgi:hypothetical protein
VSFRLQEALGFERGHAAGAGGGDGLAVDAVLHVAGVEHASDAGSRAALGEDVAVGVEFDLALKDLRVGDVASRFQVSPVFRLRSRTPVTTPLSTSKISSTVALVIHWIFGFARARSSMIFEARNSSRRCTTATSEPNRVRKIASSIAESPPPITMILLPR